MAHIPLSQRLQEVLATNPDGQEPTLDDLLQKTEGRGIYLVIILLSLPFITPIPLPGISNVLGMVIMLLSVKVMLHLPPRLPQSISQKPLTSERLRKVVLASVKLLQFIEKWIRPRKTTWLAWPAARSVNGLLLAVLGLMLALPFPPIVPFTNMFPSLALIFVAASMMEEDGVMIWVGYLLSAGALMYIYSIANLVIDLLYKYGDRIMDWLRSL